MPWCLCSNFFHSNFNCCFSFSKILMQGIVTLFVQSICRAEIGCLGWFGRFVTSLQLAFLRFISLPICNDPTFLKDRWKSADGRIRSMPVECHLMLLFSILFLLNSKFYWNTRFYIWCDFSFIYFRTEILMLTKYCNYEY